MEPAIKSNSSKNPNQFEEQKLKKLKLGLSLIKIIRKKLR
jgi:hypothetical protein